MIDIPGMPRSPLDENGAEIDEALIPEDLKVFVVQDADRHEVVGFYPTDIYPTPPENSFEVSVEDWVTYRNSPGEYRFVDQMMTPYTPPPGPPPVIVVTKFDFWDRMTEGECTAAEEAIAAQSAKKRRTFETAQTLRSDNELWGLLVQLTEGLFGEDRAAVILAPSQV
jgi:hypothetical protein